MKFALISIASFLVLWDTNRVEGENVAQQAYVKASNTDANDRFGWSVAISGDTMVLGTWEEDSSAVGVNGSQVDNAASEAGAVYVFVRNGAGWSQQAYLKASNTGAGDNFGISVAISGDTVVVGARYEDSNSNVINDNQGSNSASNAGAAYVFVREGTSWTQQAYLKASNAEANDQFGWSVSVSGDTVVVGAQEEDSNSTGVNGNQSNNSAIGSGAAYVFVRNNGIWSQQAYLKASNTDNHADEFGHSVALEDDTIVVGAKFEWSNATGVNGNQADNSAWQSGAAYVFVRDGTTWSQQAYLKASNTEINDSFGYSVGISGDTVAVYAPGEASNSTGVNGDQTNNNAWASGAAYVFVRIGTTWTQQAYLKASNAAEGDQFGKVAVSGDTIVVGAFLEDSNATGVNGNQGNNSASASGAAYVFVRHGENWSQQAYVKASNTGTTDHFGNSLAISGDTIVVGDWQDDSNAIGVNGDGSNNTSTNAGAAFVFIICPNLPGDMNCDCATNISDVFAFTSALLTGTASAGCDLFNGDMNTDGLVNGADIQGFVDLLVP